MRRDDLRALAEQEKRLHSEMLQLDETARTEKRSFTAEEQGKFDKLCEELESTRETRTRGEKLMLQDREIEKTISTPLEKRIGDMGDAPASFKEYQQQTQGTPAWDAPEVRSAYYKYMTVGSLSELDVEEQRALSRATGAAGNFLVPTDFYDQIIRSLRFMGSVATLATEYVTDNGDSIQVPANTAHGTASWTFAQVTLGANKATTKIIVSEELLQDSAFALDEFLAREFGERIGVLENTAYIQGSGTGQPQGLLSSATASNITTVTAAAGAGNTTTFTYSALVNAIFSLPKQYAGSAVLGDGVEHHDVDGGCRQRDVVQLRSFGDGDLRLAEAVPRQRVVHRQRLVRQEPVPDARFAEPAAVERQPGLDRSGHVPRVPDLYRPGRPGPGDREHQCPVR
jgi:HK97 family phage major capsid protein